MGNPSRDDLRDSAAGRRPPAATALTRGEVLAAVERLAPQIAASIDLGQYQYDVSRDAEGRITKIKSRLVDVDESPLA